MLDQATYHWVRSFLLLMLLVTSASADKTPSERLAEVKKVAEKEKTLSADFTYVTVRPTEDTKITTEIEGTVQLMKPNFADIHYNPESSYGKRIVSDGETLWTISNGSGGYTKEEADPDGKNINVWRLIIIGGFFDVEHWLQRGVYVGDLNDLEDAGTEEIDGVKYHVLEHHMTGMIQGKQCPFHQKVFIGPEGLISRFMLDFTLDGKLGSEVAELTNIKLGEEMNAEEFQFTPPANPYEDVETTP
jgi:outer membrane lipoprotein-sorting protein